MDSTYSIFFPKKRTLRQNFAKCQVSTGHCSFATSLLGSEPSAEIALDLAWDGDFFQLRGCCGDIIGDTV